MKIYRVIGHLFFIVLLFVAGYCYLERVLCSDSSFQLFKMICFEKFNIEGGRYSMALAQLIQFIPIKLGLSLNAIIFVYSVTFILIFYISYIIAVHRFKSDAAGLIIVLIIIGIRSTFFHAISESWQALTYASLFYAWLQYYHKSETIKNWAFYLIGTIALIFCFFMHPAITLPLIFIIGYHIVDRNQYGNIRYYILVAILGGISIIKFLTTPADSYEGSFLNEFNLKDIYWNFFHYYSIEYLKVHKGLWVIPLLMFGVTLVYYLFKKNYIKFLLYGASVLGMFVLFCYIFRKGDSDIGMERVYLPVTFCIIVPFVNDFMMNFKYKWLSAVALAGVLLFSFKEIRETDRFYRNRIRLMNDLISEVKQYPEKKYILTYEGPHWDYWFTWSYSFETLMLSSLHNPKDGVTIFPATNEFTTEQLQKFGNDSTFLAAGFWLTWDYNMLDSRYFQLPNQSYRVVALPDRK